MKPIKPKKPSDMFFRAGLFGILFIIVLILFVIVSKNVKTIDTSSSILNGQTRYKSFSDTEKDALKLKNAGFYRFDSDSGAMINISDRFELKTNGIFWQVTQCAIGLPSGRATKFMHIRTGYLNPFTKLTANNKDSILCDVHIIKQAYIMGSDTCYAPSSTDTTWVIVANGNRFKILGQEFLPFDTAGGALFKFFPNGVLSIVDKLTLMECPAAGRLPFYVKKAITSDMVLVKVALLTKDNIQKILDAYYRYFIASIIADAPQGVAENCKNVKVAFDLDARGNVSNARVIAISVHDTKLEQTLVSEINTWVFPGLNSTASPVVHIEREFWF